MQTMVLAVNFLHSRGANRGNDLSGLSHSNDGLCAQLAEERRRQGEMTERVLRAESLAKQGQQELQRAEAVRAQMQKDLEEATLERWAHILAWVTRCGKTGRANLCTSAP